MPKLYCVRKGYRPGIYLDWCDAQDNLHGYSNNEHRSFNDIFAARYYMTFGNTKKYLYHDDTIAHTFHGSCDVWTDGATSNNGRPNAIAGYGVFYGFNDSRNVSRRLPGSIQTNQRAELAAIHSALKQALEGRPKRLNIYTDSQYAIRCCTDWYVKWEENGYLTCSFRPVQNQDYIKAIRIIIDYLKRYRVDIRFCFVRGHGNNVGNIEADSLARSATQFFW